MAEQEISFDLTNAGLNLITRNLAGTEIVFKRIAIGDGYDNDISNFSYREALVNEVLSLTDLTILATSNNVVELITSFSQIDVEQEFWFREIGVYVVDPDNEDNEILYAYGNRNNYAEYITPHVDNFAIKKTLNFKLSVGESANIKIYMADNSETAVVDFDTSDWIYNTTTKDYELKLGVIQESIKVFKTTTTGKVDTALVDISRGMGNETVLKSLSPFIGCVICI